MVLDGRLSYSSLRAYDECRLQFLGRVLGLEPAPTVDLDFGRAVHEALAWANTVQMQTGEPVDPSLGASFFVGRLLGLLPQEPGGPLLSAMDYYWQGESKESLLGVGTELVSAYLRDIAPSFRPVLVEARLEAELDPDLFWTGKVTGVVDMVSEGSVLVEYKTARTTRRPDPLQPTFYAFLLGEPVSVTWVMLVRGPSPKVDLLESERSKADVSWLKDRYLLPRAMEIEVAMWGLVGGLGLPVPSQEDRERWVEDHLPALRSALSTPLASRWFPATPGWQCSRCPIAAECGFMPDVP